MVICCGLFSIKSKLLWATCCIQCIPFHIMLVHLKHPTFRSTLRREKKIIWKPIEIDIGFKSHRFQCTNESFEFKLNKYLVGIYICKRWWLFLFSFCFCFDKQYTMVLIIRIAFAFNELTKLPHQPHISNTDDECVINEFHCLGSFIACTYLNCACIWASANHFAFHLRCNLISAGWRDTNKETL